eukprot:CAMPEP_0177600878 /NCGR_PEP_ID=MMETSP0419_2-20121207/13915_1 /TAXON_ID=582737 /ORGANISM="Tetraselmis sp., Strain GSL018" /LENGTH=65 /DNA_ID=CAMNT_0019094015 /DNA_START=94 /DNA_END=287 /DNA_ORIENTATION=-
MKAKRPPTADNPMPAALMSDRSTIHDRPVVVCQIPPLANVRKSISVPNAEIQIHDTASPRMIAIT